MTAWYNEIDPKAAAWLRELIKAGLIAPGDVDERDIRDVTPSELVRYTQCHFFAGIGVWSWALRQAGWPDDRPVWTGSCPCQPFSPAGKGDGFDDERHLWPAWHYLIAECRPAEIYGEQVADGDGEVWLDLVLADLEGSLYAAGAVDFCAAGVGSPNIRQRLYIKAVDLAHAEGRGRRELGNAAFPRGGGYAHGSGVAQRMGEPIRTGLEGHGGDGDGSGEPGWLGEDQARSVAEADAASRMADAKYAERRPAGELNGQTQGRNGLGRGGDVGRLADTDGGDAIPERQQRGGEQRLLAASSRDSDIIVSGPTNGFWRDADWLLCRDPDGPRWRPVEPGTFPLVDGAAARMGRLRGYGNAINAKVAEEVIRATM